MIARDQFEIYDHILRLQATMSYPLEQALYQSPKWKRAKHVLDLGTTNGSYIQFLANDNPDKIFTSLECDPEMAAIAKERHTSDHLHFINGTCADLPRDYHYDFLLVRLSNGNLPDRSELPRWAVEHAHSGSEVLIIEADDDQFALHPNLPLFGGALDSLNTKPIQKAPRLSAMEQLKSEWTKAGFTAMETFQYTIDSRLPNIKESMFITMLLTAELAVGSPLPEELANELLTWVLDPNSYAHNGLVATTFVKDNSVFQQAFPTFQPIFEKLAQKR